MYYFAYGSNMSPRRFEERNIKHGYGTWAMLPDHTLVFNKKSYKNPDVVYANISPEKDGTIQGILYEIDEKDLSKLDKFEGYPKHYDRKEMTVFTNGGILSAVVYFCDNPDHIREEKINPQPEYLEYLLEGAESFPDDYVEFLKTFI